MKTEKFIRTQVETTVQGIVVIITTECNEGETTSIYNCNVSGQMEAIQEVPVKWFNVNSVLNTETREVQVNTAGSVPVGFLAALETEMIAVHDFLMSNKNGGTV